MTAVWTNPGSFDNGDSLLTTRTNINTFNLAIATDMAATESLTLSNTTGVNTLTSNYGTLSTQVDTNTADILTNTGNIDTLLTRAYFDNVYEYIKGSNITVPLTTYEEVIRLTTASVPAGVYQLDQTMLYSLDSTIHSSFFRFSVDGGVNWIEVRKEPKDNLDIVTLTYCTTVEHTGGVFEVIIQARKESLSDILLVKNIDIMFERKL